MRERHWIGKKKTCSLLSQIKVKRSPTNSGGQRRKIEKISDEFKYTEEEKNENQVNKMGVLRIEIHTH